MEKKKRFVLGKEKGQERCSVKTEKLKKMHKRKKKNSVFAVLGLGIFSFHYLSGIFCFVQF